MLNWLLLAEATPFRGRLLVISSTIPENEHAINRFAMEVNWTYWTMNWPLKLYIARDDYTIADIAIWSWYGRLRPRQGLGPSRNFLNVKDKALQAWTEKIANRPACNVA